MRTWIYRPTKNVKHNMVQPIDLNYLYTVKGVPYYLAIEIIQLQAARAAEKKAIAQKRREMGV